MLKERKTKELKVKKNRKERKKERRNKETKKQKELLDLSMRLKMETKMFRYNDIDSVV